MDGRYKTAKHTQMALRWVHLSHRIYTQIDDYKATEQLMVFVWDSKIHFLPCILLLYVYLQSVRSSKWEAISLLYIYKVYTELT